MTNSRPHKSKWTQEPTDVTCLDAISDVAQQLGLDGWSNTIQGKEQEVISLTRELRIQLMRLLDAELSPENSAGTAVTQPAPAFTDREIEVLQWASKGKSVSLTADILEVNIKTVQAAWRNIFQKLNCHNTTQCVVAAIRLGLL